MFYFTRFKDCLRLNTKKIGKKGEMVQRSIDRKTAEKKAERRPKQPHPFLLAIILYVKFMEIINILKQ